MQLKRNAYKYTGGQIDCRRSTKCVVWLLFRYSGSLRGNNGNFDVSGWKSGGGSSRRQIIRFVLGNVNGVHALSKCASIIIASHMSCLHVLSFSG